MAGGKRSRNTSNNVKAAKATRIDTQVEEQLTNSMTPGDESKQTRKDSQNRSKVS